MIRRYKLSKRSDVKKLSDTLSKEETDFKGNKDWAKYIEDKVLAEQNKSENEKQHDKYVKYQKSKAHAPDLKIVPAMKIKPKPGMSFEGNIKTLLERFDFDIETVFKHMTLGQFVKYYEENGSIYKMKDQSLVFNGETKEILQDN